MVQVRNKTYSTNPNRPMLCSGVSNMSIAMGKDTGTMASSNFLNRIKDCRRFSYYSYKSWFPKNGHSTNLRQKLAARKYWLLTHNKGPTNTFEGKIDKIVDQNISIFKSHTTNFIFLSCPPPPPPTFVSGNAGVKQGEYIFRKTLRRQRISTTSISLFLTALLINVFDFDLRLLISFFHGLLVKTVIKSRLVRLISLY